MGAGEARIESGEIYEWQQIHDGNYYGGSRKVLQKHLDGGKLLIKDIDVLGASTYKEKLSDITKILSVFLYVEDLDMLLERMRTRGDSEEEIAKRALRFPMEMAESVNCDYLVNNERIADTTDAVNALLRSEETGIGLYRPAAGCTANECDIASRCDEMNAAEALESVQLAFNGQELLITEGADRYAAALRKGRFIQKQIKGLTDCSLQPAAVSLKEWGRICGIQ